MENNIESFSADLKGKIKSCINFYSRCDKYLESQITNEILKIYTAHSSLVDPEMLLSIVERICIVINNGIFGIENALEDNEKNKRVNLLKEPISPVYGVEFASQNKVVLFEFFEQKYSSSGYYDDKNRPVVVSLDLDRGRIYIQKRNFILDQSRGRIDMSTTTYCLPSAREVFCLRSKDEEDESINNIFICDAFHPGRMDNYKHYNSIDNIMMKDEEEKKLLKEIIGESAKEPHFHIYADDISFSFKKNTKSLAININDLLKYLNILITNAECLNIDVLTPKIIEKIKKKDGFMPDVFMFDLFMPYLSILKGDIEYKNDGIIEKIKKLLVEYIGRSKGKDKKIMDMYEILSNIRADDESFKKGGGTGICGLRAIVRDIEILSFLMDSFPDLQMSMKELYNGNFKLNTEFIMQKEKEREIKAFIPTGTATNMDVAPHKGGKILL